MKKMRSKLENIHDICAVTGFVLEVFSWFLMAEDGCNLINGVLCISGLSIMLCCSLMAALLEDM